MILWWQQVSIWTQSVLCNLLNRYGVDLAWVGQLDDRSGFSWVQFYPFPNLLHSIINLGDKAMLDIQYCVQTDSKRCSRFDDMLEPLNGIEIDCC